jgi:hypothetical protein
MSLPLSEHDTIRDCVHVYCEWLSALYPVPKISVPRPVCEDPNLYARKMICHFHNLFVPRKGEGKLDLRLLQIHNVLIGLVVQTGMLYIDSYMHLISSHNFFFLQNYVVRNFGA